LFALTERSYNLIVGRAWSVAGAPRGRDGPPSYCSRSRSAPTTSLLAVP